MGILAGSTPPAAESPTKDEGGTMIDLLFALAMMTAPASVQTQETPPDVETLDGAIECVIYIDLAKSMHRGEGDARMLAMDERLGRYWQKRVDGLAKKEGVSGERLTIRRLVIPIKAERYRPVIGACLDKTPEKALR